ncbi:FAD-dependent monooxygenase, partial [Pseudomonas aeruginosa]|nr:FAD-dependent monooxygenase [Pseudomonas aeruginosa]
MSITEQVDVAIVGSGPAGLAAAIELRRQGVARVCVLERDGEAGGYPPRPVQPVRRYAARRPGQSTGGRARAGRTADARNAGVYR